MKYKPGTYTCTPFSASTVPLDITEDSRMRITDGYGNAIVVDIQNFDKFETLIRNIRLNYIKADK